MDLIQAKSEALKHKSSKAGGLQTLAKKKEGTRTMHTFNIEADGNTATINRQCTKCKGMGLYKGLAERDCFAVVCHTCRGTGREKVKVDITPFTGRKPASKNVTTVVEVNPGICLGVNKEMGLTDASFGGMSYVEWAQGKPFPPGSENRDFTCPQWWYQNANHKKLPGWEECYDNLGRTFSKCKSFGSKAACWARFDTEQAEEGSDT